MYLFTNFSCSCKKSYKRITPRGKPTKFCSAKFYTFSPPKTPFDLRKTRHVVLPSPWENVRGKQEAVPRMRLGCEASIAKPMLHFFGTGRRGRRPLRRNAQNLRGRGWRLRQPALKRCYFTFERTVEVGVPRNECASFGGSRDDPY